MIKLKEEELLNRALLPAQFISDEEKIIAQKKLIARETVLQRCQRVLANWIPNHLSIIKQCFEEDLLLAKTSVQVLCFLLFLGLINYAMKWSVSTIEFCYWIILSIVANYTKRLLKRISNLITQSQFGEESPLHIQKLYYFSLICSQFTDFSLSQSADWFLISKFIFVYADLLRSWCVQGKQMFPKASRWPKIVWAFLRLTLSILLRIWPTIFTFENEIMCLISFVIVSELLGCICAATECIIAGRGLRSKKDNKVAFMYSQIHYSEFTKLTIFSLYQLSSIFSLILMVLMTVLQSLIYRWLRIKFKPYILLLKEAKNISEKVLIVKCRNNQWMRMKNTEKYGYMRLKTLKEKNNFEDELCCWCNQRKANAGNSDCEHVCICSACFDLKKRKIWKSLAAHMGCPICNERILVIIKLHQFSYQQFVRQILQKSDECIFFFAGYDFELRTLFDDNPQNG